MSLGLPLRIVYKDQTNGKKTDSLQSLTKNGESTSTVSEILYMITIQLDFMLNISQLKPNQNLE